MPPSVEAGVPELCAVISDCIERSPHRRVTFATFMELALYHPQQGYYAAQAGQLGRRGDFVTAAHMGRDFAELLAVQFVEMWQHLGQPQPFQLVEMGPGQGLLAGGVLTYLQRWHPDCLAALHYTLVETSPALRAAQQQHLAPWHPHVTLEWCELAALPPITGCLFSNELVDAFPVHLVTLTPRGLQEQYVTLTGDAPRPFTFVAAAPSTSALAAYFHQAGIEATCPPYPEGYTTEVNLAALEWMAQVASKLHRGYVLTIDYGYPADRYYSLARSHGTLQCYTRHAHHNDPLINVGRQDITAHVDFTTLQRQGEQQGLETLGCTQQGLFLMALGLGDRLSALTQLSGTDSATLRYALQQRDTLHQLISPLGLGSFTVLIQGKGLTQPPQKALQGLTIPPLAGG
ncbi:MAG TPA: class I SAM-dependent methyltransferase [Candidatus Obscuribacterales bacterium]